MTTGTDNQKPLSMTATIHSQRALNTGLESAKINNLPCSIPQATNTKKEGTK